MLISPVCKTTKRVNNPKQMKSPSDTTIYVPGLNRMSSCGDNAGGNIMLEKITNFVDQMRIQHDQASTHSEGVASRVVRPSQRDLQEASTSRQDEVDDENEELPTDDANSVANKLIVEAEQFKATIERPTGTLSDDDFFHLICHVDQNTIAKIERGEYVDLEKLYPHDKGRKQMYDLNEDMILKQRDGATYLGPPVRERHITRVRRWEKAFRIYATIYCKANPIRTGEIWQYIEDINTAASAYVWDNIVHYDYVFRQLMAFNPKRSWAVTYTKMWNLSMVEPISRNSNFGFNGRHNGGYGQNGNKAPKSRDNESGDGPGPKYCWPFNRGYCKYGQKCRYENRRSFCDSPKHGRNSCYKLSNKNSTPLKA